MDVAIIYTSRLTFKVCVCSLKVCDATSTHIYVCRVLHRFEGCAFFHLGAHACMLGIQSTRDVAPSLTYVSYSKLFFFWISITPVALCHVVMEFYLTTTREAIL